MKTSKIIIFCIFLLVKISYAQDKIAYGTFNGYFYDRGTIIIRFSMDYSHPDSAIIEELEMEYAYYQFNNVKDGYKIKDSTLVWEGIYFKLSDGSLFPDIKHLFKTFKITYIEKKIDRWTIRYIKNIEYSD